MKISPFVAAAAILALSACLAAAPSKDGREIRALYAKLAKAMKALDVRAVEATQAPGYTTTVGGRTISAAESHNQRVAELKLLKSVDRFDVKVTSLKISGKTAHATTSFTFVAKLSGRDKKLHTLAVTGTTVEELVKTRNGWLFKSEKETASQTSMDGRKQG